VDPLISAGTLLEASIVLQSKLGAIGLADFDELLATAGVRCIAVDLAQARALAKVAQAPLLFKGEDFRQTDLVAAVIA
jgi:uncharacterized protein with PIN domain